MGASTIPLEVDSIANIICNIVTWIVFASRQNAIMLVLLRFPRSILIEPHLDTNYFKREECPHPLKAVHFNDLSLNSDSELLNPQVLATAIDTDKSILTKKGKK